MIRGAPGASGWLLILLVLGGMSLSRPPAAAAQEELPPLDDPAPEQEGRGRLYDLESWIVLEEEAAPEPPLVRIEGGLVAWVEVRSEIQVDRGGQPGTFLRDLENEQGLTFGGAAPWIELSIGGKVRGGGDLTWFERDGDYQVQEDPVVFSGRTLAQPKDLIRAHFHLVSMAGFVEWDALYGETYRIGLVGGIRYFRLDVDLDAARRSLRPAGVTGRARGELLSPFFGGLVELVPFPYLSVFSRIQFMSWSWESVGLKEARYFQFRLGFAVHLVPCRLAVGAEYRFTTIRAEPDAPDNPGGRRIRAGIAANGLAFTITLSF